MTLLKHAGKYSSTWFSHLFKELAGQYEEL